jgi:hypothetical protein
MNRVAASFITSAAVLAIAACADSATKVTAPSTLKPSLSANSAPGQTHVMLTRSLAEAARNANPNAGLPILYHGGPLLIQTKVVPVYWAAAPIYTSGPAAGTFSTTSPAGDRSLVMRFLRSLTGSAYFNINTTYYDGTNTHVQNVVQATGYWADNVNVPADGQVVTNAQLIGVLQSGFDGGQLVYDANTVYPIFTAGTVNPGGGFGSSYCAYHGYGNVTIAGVTKTVIYAAMPYVQSYPSGCTPNLPSPNADVAANSEVNVLAHEVEESTTDFHLNAWFDQQGAENADKCAWTFGTIYTTGNGGKANMNIRGVDYLIQRNWIQVPNAGSCSTGI